MLSRGVKLLGQRWASHTQNYNAEGQRNSLHSDFLQSYARKALVANDHGMLIAKHMPKGPKGQKRPADVIGNAVRVMKIATGEETETLENGKNAAAVALGRKGGAARAKSLSAKKRREIAKRAAGARWRP